MAWTPTTAYAGDWAFRDDVEDAQLVPKDAEASGEMYYDEDAQRKRDEL